MDTNTNYFFLEKYQAEFLIFFFQFEYCREMLLHASQSLDERKTRISRQKKVKKTQQFSFPCLGWWQNSTILSLQWQPENCRIDFVFFHSFFFEILQNYKIRSHFEYTKGKRKASIIPLFFGYQWRYCDPQNKDRIRAKAYLSCRNH